MKALELLYELVAVRSDTGSSYEVALGNKIYEIISQDEFFKENPQYCGKEVFGDFLGRPLVWAFKPGKTKQTVFLSGHYDAVEIESYGTLKEFATKPDELREQMKAMDLSGKVREEIITDLNNEDWMFGRGCADMKGGLAVAMEILLSAKDLDASILFVAVHDEENISAGMRRAMPLVKRLQEQYQMDFKFCLIGEPQINDPEKSKQVAMYAGGAGKVLPMILAKGFLSHSAQALEGLNASYMISEVVREIELNTDFISSDYGISVHPPTVLMQKDLKPSYDVSLVEYAMAGINVLFMESISPLELMDKVEASCMIAMEHVAEKYKKAFEQSEKIGVVKKEQLKNFHPNVMRLEQLIALVKEKEANFDQIQTEKNEVLNTKILNGELTLMQASVEYMQDLAKRSEIKDPFLVIGIAPPYYPAVTSCRLEGGISRLETLYKEAAKEQGLEGKVCPYFAGMGDISYMMCRDSVGQRALMDNLTLPANVNDIPFEEIEALSMPSFWMGPRSKDIHQWTERVYKPDIQVTLPAMMRYLIEHIVCEEI